MYTFVIVTLTLVYYFVLDFRGNPFGLFDIFNIVTAASDTGTYVYEISVRLLVHIRCLILFLVILFHFQDKNGKRQLRTK